MNDVTQNINRQITCATQDVNCMQRTYIVLGVATLTALFPQNCNLQTALYWSHQVYLNGRRVSNESRWHFQSARRNIADSCLYVTGNPFDEVAAVLVLDIEHLFVHFFHRHSPSKDSCDCQVTTMTRIARCHHIFCVEHLLREFWYRESSVLLRTSVSERTIYATWQTLSFLSSN